MHAASAAVLEETLDEMAAEPGGVRLDERDAHQPTVGTAPRRAQIRGVAVRRRRGTGRGRGEVDRPDALVDRGDQRVAVRWALRLQRGFNS